MEDGIQEVDHLAGVQSLELAFFGEFKLTTADQPTVIKVAGLYVYYNRKKGINADTLEHGDDVLLHKYNEAHNIARGSSLVGWLDTDEQNRYTNQTLNLAIQVCERRDSFDEISPDVMVLSIGTLDDVLCIAPLSLPTASPTP